MVKCMVEVGGGGGGGGGGKGVIVDESGDILVLIL